MAEQPFAPAARVIPNWALPTPWSDPTSPELDEQLAMSAYLSVLSENEGLLAVVLGDFPVRYQQALNVAQA